VDRLRSDEHAAHDDVVQLPGGDEPGGLGLAYEQLAGRFGLRLAAAEIRGQDRAAAREAVGQPAPLKRYRGFGRAAAALRVRLERREPFGQLLRLLGAEVYIARRKPKFAHAGQGG